MLRFSRQAAFALGTRLRAGDGGRMSGEQGQANKGGRRRGTAAAVPHLTASSAAARPAGFRAARAGGSGATRPRARRWEDVRYPFVTRGNLDLAVGCLLPRRS